MASRRLGGDGGPLECSGLQRGLSGESGCLAAVRALFIAVAALEEGYRVAFQGGSRGHLAVGILSALAGRYPLRMPARRPARYKNKIKKGTRAASYGTKRTLGAAACPPWTLLPRHQATRDHFRPFVTCATLGLVRLAGRASPLFISAGPSAPWLRTPSLFDGLLSALAGHGREHEQLVCTNRV